MTSDGVTWCRSASCGAIQRQGWCLALCAPGYFWSKAVFDRDPK
ncbi:hypothetical protein [Streptomyces sp. 142MFCol3.1]|nr:hypothetical protein [Streptomyces sp. 142MFCol3.1]